MDKIEKQKNIYKILCIILLIILIVVLVMWGHSTLVEKSAAKTYEKLQESVNSNASDTKTQASETEQQSTQVLENAGDTETDSHKEQYDIPHKNLDWEELEAVNLDIYAWIYIPNTNIDYPVLQRSGDNDYYLEHNLDGSRGKPGCIYTEDLNSKEFTDYNTVIYGHNMKSGAMFRTLHDFEDKSFFDNNQYVYIYTKDRTLVYKIFAAYTNDAKHILNSNDFTSEQGLSDYLEKVFKKAQAEGYLRDDVAVTGENAILTLSTCTTSSDKRYIVQAVLVNE